MNFRVGKLIMLIKLHQNMVYETIKLKCSNNNHHIKKVELLIVIQLNY